MEWKQSSRHNLTPSISTLGNFLSGMETLGDKSWAAGGRGLGNFLSGMETHSQAYGFAKDVFPLGNFLSGMETGQMQVRGVGLAVPWKLP